VLADVIGAGNVRRLRTVSVADEAEADVVVVLSEAGTA
jgi:hypothetical protein